MKTVVVLLETERKVSGLRFPGWSMARDVLISMADGLSPMYIQRTLIDSVGLTLKGREHEIGKGMEDTWEELKGNGQYI